MAGRRPKPTALKILEGNPGKRALPKREAKPPRPASLQPPAHLSDDAKIEWNRLAQPLVTLGLLTDNDLAAFEGYCSSYGVLVQASRLIATCGLTYEHNGIVRKRPEVSIRAEALREMRKYAGEFGLTPSTRAKVAAAQLAGQPKLPGADKWPDQPDPAKPKIPDGPWTDEAFFGEEKAARARPN